MNSDIKVEYSGEMKKVREREMFEKVYNIYIFKKKWMLKKIIEKLENNNNNDVNIDVT